MSDNEKIGFFGAENNELEEIDSIVSDILDRRMSTIARIRAEKSVLQAKIAAYNDALAKLGVPVDDVDPLVVRVMNGSKEVQNVGVSIIGGIDSTGRVGISSVTATATPAAPAVPGSIPAHAVGMLVPPPGQAMPVPAPNVAASPAVTADMSLTDAMAAATAQAKQIAAGGVQAAPGVPVAVGAVGAAPQTQYCLPHCRLPHAHTTPPEAPKHHGSQTPGASTLSHPGRLS